jgi:CRISPR-associated protein (TIGR02584 family)
MLNALFMSRLSKTRADLKVLTETLYALHTLGKLFPNEVWVSTRKDAKDMLTKELFEKSHWQKLPESIS